MTDLFDQDALDAPAVYTDRVALARWPEMSRRLRFAGATVDMIRDFRDQWLHDPEWPQVDRERVWALGDGQLHAEVVRLEEVNQRNLETEESRAVREAIDEAGALRAQVRQAALEMSAWDVDSIASWVGDDEDRARASLAVEQAHPRPRPELVQWLNRKLRIIR